MVSKDGGPLTPEEIAELEPAEVLSILGGTLPASSIDAIRELFTHYGQETLLEGASDAVLEELATRLHAGSNFLVLFFQTVVDLIVERERKRFTPEDEEAMGIIRRAAAKLGTIPS